MNSAKRLLVLVATGFIVICLGVFYAMHVRHRRDEAVNYDSLPLNILQTKAAHGNAKAQFALGLRHQFGRGVPMDAAEMVKWYRKAAEQNLAAAQFKIYECYWRGLGVKKDESDMIKWLRKAADNGDAEAQYRLGHKYKAEKNSAEADKWYLRAFNSSLALAEHGDAQAQVRLGNMYGWGNGVAQNFIEAAKWRRKAAEKESPEIQTELGFDYELGLGLPMDLGEAAKWYLKAAERGNARAQANIANFYYSGRGVSEDKSKAIKWLELSVAQGVKGLSNGIQTPHEEALITDCYNANLAYLEAIQRFVKARLELEESKERLRRLY